MAGLHLFHGRRSVQDVQLLRLQQVQGHQQDELKQVLRKLEDVSGQLQRLPAETASILSQATLGPRGVSNCSQSRLSDAVELNRLEQLEAIRENLEAQLQASDTEIQRLRSSEAGLRKQVEQLQNQRMTFGNIILENVGTQKVVDHDVVVAFSQLRQQVQALARNSALATDQEPLTMQEMPDDMKRFYAPWYRGLGANDLGFRLRGQIFKLLDESILSQSCYGLTLDARTEESTKYHDIEESFRQFEMLLEREEGINRAADWRINTLKYIKSLNLSDQASMIAAEKIIYFLSPLVSTQATNKEREDLETEIRRTCNQALHLRLEMRRSKEGYSCQALGTTDVPSNAHLAEPFAVEGGRPAEGSNEIAYVLFGALVKVPVDGEPKVLEKAQVILKRR